MDAREVLLLTVGTGTADELESTLIRPSRKSLEKGQWAKVILLPSKKTEPNALLLKRVFPGYPIEVSALPKEGDEEDADACFAHFARRIEQLLEEGFQAERITADITRGTKPMSAGLMMAAAAHSVGKIRYISAGRRDERGMAVPGTEQTKDIEIGKVFRRRHLELALELLRHGNFAAVGTLFPGAPKVRRVGYLEEEILWVAWAAAFWGAWDRFDYPEAARLARRDGMPPEAPPLAAPWLPTAEQQKLLEVLAGPAPPNNPDNAGYCRALAADLIANARRRLRERRYEEVLVRLYRILELMGQLRLFSHGIDTDRISTKDKALAAWFEENPHLRRGGARIALGRQDAARLLEWLEQNKGDAAGIELARTLADPAWLGALRPQTRNRSVLVHGFSAATRGAEGQRLSAALEKVADLYRREHPRNGLWLEAAHFSFLVPPENAA